MNQDRSIFSWSIPLGRWFAVQVKLSVFFILIALVLVFHLGDWRIGLTFGFMLFLSVLLHEFGHVFAARFTGGDGDEVIITPFGGLAMCRPASSISSQFWTTAGGPIVNLGLCLVTLMPVLQSSYTADCFNPLVFPPVSLEGKAFSDAVPDVLIILFAANWLLLLINLIPVHPLDGGRMLQTILFTRHDRFVANSIYAKTGAIAGVLFLVAGLLLENTTIMLIGAIVLYLNAMETFQMQSGEQQDESFLGYDFSQGYTSLERSSYDDDTFDEETHHEKELGFFAKRKNQKEEERRRKREEEDRAMEEKLDELLAKLHASGEDGLSPAEHRQLKEISERLRNRQQG